MVRWSPARAIVVGGLLGGLGDFVFAFAYYGLRLGVFQNVAGGLIGPAAARAGGVPTFVLGVVLHFGIAILWAAIYAGISRRIPALLRRPLPAGLVFGAVVFYGMNCVVLPLSALHTRAWPPPWAPVPLAVHMLFVGLPMAVVASLAARRSSSTASGKGVEPAP